MAEPRPSPSGPHDVEREIDQLISSLGYLNRRLTQKVGLVGMSHTTSRTHFGLGPRGGRLATGRNHR
jgi:hypothetical protein